MSDKLKFTINVSSQTEEIEKIRASLGIEKADLTLIPVAVDRELEPDTKIESLFYNGFLIDPKTRQLVFLYIRDHSYVDYRSRKNDAVNLNKVHFTVCRKLKEMCNNGREERYHVTNRTDDLYPIEYKDGEEQLVRLLPCQICLEQSEYKCFDFSMSPDERIGIAESFSAKDAIDLMTEHYRLFTQSKNFHHQYDPTGYTYGWAEKSRTFRLSKNFTCNKCGVNLAECPNLTDAHHVDGVKRNNSNNNLECLCKLCHQKIHPHLTISPKAKEEILSKRKQQGIAT